MKNILIVCFNSFWNPHLGAELEIAQEQINQKNNVFILTCNKNLEKGCIACTTSTNKNICDDCCKIANKAYSLLDIPKKNIIQMKKVRKIKFPNFKTIKDLKEYNINGINLGLGVFSSYISLTRKVFTDEILYSKLKDTLLHSAYSAYINFSNILKKRNFDAVYIFNGRFAEHNPIVELCKQNKIDFYIHERGCSKNHYQIIKNERLHNLDRYKKEIQTFWDCENNLEKKCNLAKKWFNDRRNKIEQSWYSFTKDQQANKIPENLNNQKENIVIFNSSIDEYYAFNEWASEIEENDNTLIKNIIEHYKSDKNKHFYLRVHPNLKNVQNKQMDEIIDLQKENYKNLTIILPDEDIDSYAMIDACDKIITFGSTIGLEATFWGKPSILAGKSLYDNLNCTYTVNNYTTLFNLIENKNIKAKPKENTYPYAFWESTYGIPFKYYQASSLSFGTFKGVDYTQIREKKEHKIIKFLGIKISIKKRKK